MKSQLLLHLRLPCLQEAVQEILSAFEHVLLVNAQVPALWEVEVNVHSFEGAAEALSPNGRTPGGGQPLARVRCPHATSS